MIKLKYKNFIYLTDNEKLLVLEWRNSDRIRTKMVNQEIIRLENHLKWLEGLKQREDCKYFLFYVNDNLVGTFCYNDIDLLNKSCSCGSDIGNINFIGFGIILNYYGFFNAFFNFDYSRINISVLKNNKRVYQLHKTFFYAIDDNNDENEYFLHYDKLSFNKNKNTIEDKISKLYGDKISTEWIL